MNRYSLDVDSLSCNVQEALLERVAYLSGVTESQRLTIRRFQTSPVQAMYNSTIKFLVIIALLDNEEYLLALEL